MVGIAVDDFLLVFRLSHFGSNYDRLVLQSLLLVPLLRSSSLTLPTGIIGPDCLSTYIVAIGILYLLGHFSAGHDCRCLRWLHHHRVTWPVLSHCRSLGPPRAFNCRRWAFSNLIPASFGPHLGRRHCRRVHRLWLHRSWPSPGTAMLPCRMLTLAHRFDRVGWSNMVANWPNPFTQLGLFKPTRFFCHCFKLVLNDSRYVEPLANVDLLLRAKIPSP